MRNDVGSKLGFLTAGDRGPSRLPQEVEMLPERLSPLDASFLSVESPTAHMHVGWAAVFEPPAGERPNFEELRDHIAARVPRAPRYRQMLREVPLGLNAPVWVDDMNFSVERHVVASSSPRLEDAIDEAMSE